MVALTEAYVKAKTRIDRLDDIKNLNLWGQDLSDVSLLQQMPNLEVLSLSVNSIASLKEFRHCARLQELYLRKNTVSDLQEVRYLAGLRDLKVLWLCDNPCADHPSYRLIVAKALPNLVKLDNMELSPDEKAAAASLPSFPPPSPQAEPQSSASFGRVDESMDGPSSSHSSPLRSISGRMAEPRQSVDYYSSQAQQQQLQQQQLQQQQAAAAAAAAQQAAMMQQQQQQAAAAAAQAQAQAQAAAAAARQAAYVQQQQQAAADAAAYERQQAAAAAAYERQQGSSYERQASGAGSYEAAAAAAAVASARQRSSKNVLYAVMALIPELADDDLAIVRGEIEQRLAPQRYR